MNARLFPVAAPVVLALGLAGLGASACRRHTPAPAPPPLPRLGDVQVADLTPPAAGITAGAPGLADELRRQLGASGLVAAGPPADGTAGSAGAGAPPGPVLRLRGQVAVESVEVGAKGVVRTNVRLVLRSRPEDAPGAINEDLTAAGEREYAVRAGTDRAALAQALASRTAADLLSAFIARRRLATAVPADVRAAIVAKDGDRSLWQEAIRQVGARGLKDEAGVLLPLLADPDEEIRDAALGALVALRDRRAVHELTQSRSLQDQREMRKILDVIAVLGGDEARDYLSFVAETHEDEEIRRLAAAARRRLDSDAAPAR
jgi:hypothetical protein